MDLNGLHFARSISAAIRNDGIVLPIYVLTIFANLKEGGRKGEGGRFTPIFNRGEKCPNSNNVSPLCEVWGYAKHRTRTQVIRLD
jgi:hypothetical protein